MIKNLKQCISKRLHHFFTLSDSSHNIAAGAALGVFLGILPGEGIATTLILATFLKWNRASASIGVLATNFWGSIVTLPVAALVGAVLFHENANSLINQFYASYELGWRYFLSKAVLFDLALPLFVGFCVISFFFSILIYLLLKFMIEQHRNTRV